jgi:hypothetical protein
MFDFDQYQQDSIDSKSNPLDRRLLVGFEQVGVEIEVFALPGFETNPKRYLLSLRSTALAVKRNPNSLLGFLGSMTFKRKLSQAFDCTSWKSLQFKSTAFNDTFSGIPGWLALWFWRQQDKLGNEIAGQIIDVLIESKLDDLASDSFQIIRTPEQRVQNFTTTWQQYRDNTKAGFKKLRTFFQQKYTHYYLQYPNNSFIRQNITSLIKRDVNGVLKEICATIVYRLTNLYPIQIYEVLKLDDDTVDELKLRDWYSTELLEAIDNIQEALFKALLDDSGVDPIIQVSLIIDQIGYASSMDWRKEK